MNQNMKIRKLAWMGLLASLAIFFGYVVMLFPVFVSIGGITHNLGQIVIAALVVENVNLFYYLPALMIAGLVTGLLIGIVTGEILKRASIKIR